MPIREKVLLKFELLHCSEFTCLFPGADPGFQVRGGALKFFFGVFRVKNHDLTPKNHIFSNLRAPPRDPSLPTIVHRKAIRIIT